MNRIPIAALSLMLTFLAAPHGLAQQHGSINHHKAAEGKDPATSSYFGMETRRVKALSDEQISDLMAGRGMGLALAAELNSYPGPSHVLDLRDALDLSDEQASRTKALLDQMKAETIPLGRRIIEEETELDRLFSERKIISAHLVEMTKTIADGQGALRAAHLRYHLDMAELLTSEQIGRYSQLRGYSGRVD
ncbi:periplasmic heavy metal sensor [Mesorhizobium mediterraneum]|uniref:Periplasmic heavy metal sensor n=1 Tax=Mesorhizobium mediterraneum TaxID=43617 RepID=A0AB36R8G4_9HYPH|nr:MULTISPECIES: periplasmic heavy metal sensor [Mesorhizobium]PAQ01211.1 hypothetical protein CIT25_14050 [Mesorhizobium mediterraneum]RWN34975.1 MAG: periplasmic heavy metal sensor [Mesorhizobium sp.]RWO96023.1 MAG: periplasmic heavy metal sensor [Mesorhizobium sp.]WIW51517.1 periplasmic heavy metal sensor [Mesorhizobium mediterraneum]